MRKLRMFLPCWFGCGEPGWAGARWRLNDGRDMAARPFPSSRGPINPYTVSLEEFSLGREHPLGGSLVRTVFQNCSRKTVGASRLTACKTLPIHSQGVVRVRSGSTKPLAYGRAIGTLSNRLRVLGLKTFALAALDTR